MTTVASAQALEVPITREDLPLLDAREVELRNADLGRLGPLVFSVAGVPLRFERAPDTAHQTAPPPAGTWLWLSWAGLPLLAAVSPAFSDAVTQSMADVALDQLGESGLNLFAQLMLAPRLPTGLTLRQATRTREALQEMPQGLELLGRWQGRHLNSGEPSWHQVSLWGAADFPLGALLDALAHLAFSRRASPLARFPIALPLVAARWSVDAEVLQDLAVGDVLMLG
jgi:hypothetical protein